MSSQILIMTRTLCCSIWGFDDEAAFVERSVHTFRCFALTLTPHEWIELHIFTACDAIETMRALLSEPMACRIKTLVWTDKGCEDFCDIDALLVCSCPELCDVALDFDTFSTLGFYASLLQQPNNRLQKLTLSPSHLCDEGNCEAFFSALRQSAVTTLSVCDWEYRDFVHLLCDYLVEDRLVELYVWHKRSDLSGLVTAIAGCERLTKLSFYFFMGHRSAADILAHIPKSVATLSFDDGAFGNGFDWSFLHYSGVQDLEISNIENVDRDRLGAALDARLRVGPMDRLSLNAGAIHDLETFLPVVGTSVSRIKSLELRNVYNLTAPTCAILAEALHLPECVMTELSFRYNDYVAYSIDHELLPAINHPACRLSKLYVGCGWTHHGDRVDTIMTSFYNRNALFVLLQGQQVRRLNHGLRRLPVELFRMVGALLM